MKVFTVRNLSDIRRSEIYTGYIDKNFHTCPFTVYVRTMSPLLHPPELFRNNDAYNQTVYDKGFEIEMLKVFANAFNMSLNIASSGEVLDILITAVGKGWRGQGG